MKRQFQVFVEHDPSEKAWVTYVPALDHLSTFGSTRDEALGNTREAIPGYLEAADKEGIELSANYRRQSAWSFWITLGRSFLPEPLLAILRQAEVSVDDLVQLLKA
jgi:predicted RNase H-like HicB family nuclease